ncbi:Segment polarity protein dishevelled DVL-3 [Echinococcus granulosus]|uniref:Segment polarity protein dishevelled DVL-3 n=1 Tax=Echinococcus granulosus TaxID=6210 RepID=W6UQ43_ECHGR|nr:Segment polarity protein dishevelled DVL-3 [Echinococcus granulosus]EUB62916.1 Segment polarity protein dishevelled DVL-3 [Echinococcus granulosus]
MASAPSNDGTRIIYYVDEEDTPYLVKLNAPSDSVTLGDFKLALSKPNCKFFFKSIDDDFGVVKEEITDDSAKLPCFNGRVISWLVSNDNCAGSSDGGSGLNAVKLAALAGAQIGDGTQPPEKSRFGEKKINGTSKKPTDECDTCTEDTESVQSGGQDHIAPLRTFHDYKHVAGTAAEDDPVSSPYLEVAVWRLGSCNLRVVFSNEPIANESETGTQRQGKRLVSRRLQPNWQSKLLDSRWLGNLVLNAVVSKTSIMLNGFGSLISGSRYGGSHHYHRHHFGGGGNGVYGGGSSVSSGRHHHHHHMRAIYGGGGGGGSSVYEAPSSMMSSDLESTSFFESDGESSSHVYAPSISFDLTAFGKIPALFVFLPGLPPGFLEPLGQPYLQGTAGPGSGEGDGDSSPLVAITDSTMSLNIITVTLNMDSVNFLGISIVGQSTKSGDDGIYVGSIMKGGAVAQDGRIEPGDMILEVNGISFEDMSNDDAVRTLREQVQNPGPITLVVAKCWDANPRGGYFTIPRQEPVRPIDPRAWVLHTNAMTAGGAQSVVTLSSSLPETDRFGLPPEPLTVATDVKTVIQAMMHPDSGLDIRDRVWLKITLPNAFIGSDLVDWLFRNVEGLSDRRDCRKYAANLLKFGLIRHTVNKSTFSEQCYYVFGDITGTLSLEEVDSVSEIGALAAVQQNWSHSTASTSLATGGGGSGAPVAMATQPQPSQAAQQQQQQVAPVSTADPFGVGLPSSVFHSVGGKPAPQHPRQNGFRLSNNGLVDIPLRRMMSSGSSSSSSSCESATENTLSTTDKIDLNGGGGTSLSPFLPTATSSFRGAQKLDPVGSVQQQPTPPTRKAGGVDNRSTSSGSSSEDEGEQAVASGLIPPLGQQHQAPPPPPPSSLLQTTPGPVQPPPPPRASPATSSLYLNS